MNGALTTTSRGAERNRAGFSRLTVPVYAAQSVPRAGIFGRMMTGLRALILACTRNDRAAASSASKAGRAPANPPRRAGSRRRWRSAAFPASSRANRADRRARRKSANCLSMAIPDAGSALTETLLALCGAGRPCRAHDQARRLQQGRWVICDRFADSTYAYQGAGRGLDRETVRRIEAVAIGDFKPDLTF